MKNKRCHQRTWARNGRTDQPPVAEDLEPRLLMSAGDPTQVIGSTLYVHGTNRADAVEIQRSASGVTVEVNGARQQFLGTIRRVRAYGYNGDDSIRLTGNIPLTAFGGSGKDTLEGGSARDYLYGQSGRDTLKGNGGNDVLNGGVENLGTFSGLPSSTWFRSRNLGGDRIYGGDGDDIIYGGDVRARAITGYIRRSYGFVPQYGYRYEGIPGDVIYGGAGNDKIYGGGGDDVIYGQGGRDVIHAGAGHDRVYGGDETQRTYRRVVINNRVAYMAVISDAEGDEIHGGSGNDYLLGQRGHDKLYGDAGRDRVYGQTGNDRLVGGEGNDYLRGGSGMDALFAHEGTDAIYGGSGSDRIYVLDYDLADALAAGEDAAFVVNSLSEGDPEWTQSELDQVDDALGLLHEINGTDVMIQTSANRQVVLNRTVGLPDWPTENFFGLGNILVGDAAFERPGIIAPAMVGAMAEYWADQSGDYFVNWADNPYWDSFLAQAGWSDDDHSGQSGWTQASSGAARWYRSSAEFVCEDARWSPAADWVSCVTAYFYGAPDRWNDGEVDTDHSWLRQNVPGKYQIINDFLRNFRFSGID